MSKVKVKKVKMTLGPKNEELSDMFNQMIGTGLVNISIAYPRYKRIKHLCEQLVKLFQLLLESPFMRSYTEFAPQARQLQDFCTSTRNKIDELFSLDFTEFEWNLSSVDEPRQKAFSDLYGKMKQSELVKTFVILCDHLVPYKKHFENINSLNHKFIMNMAGVVWSPFPFTDLNLKYIFSLPSVGDNTIRFFMTILHKAYELSRQLYDEIQSPDIDIEQLTDVIMMNIDEVQKRPELSRCGDAFRKIKESVCLLKDRLGGYYRDFVATGDSTIMMQHFVIDVSKETKAGPKIIRQFGVIADYYRDIAKNQVTNPKLKILIDKINDSFKELERGTTNLVNINDEQVAPDDPDDSDPIVGAGAMSVASLLDDLERPADDKKVD